MKISWTSWFAIAALVAIVAAVLIPSGGDYRHRSQNTEAITLMLVAKAPLAEYFADHKRWPKSLEEVGAQTGGKYTLSVAITKGAGGTGELELTATMRSERVDRRVAGQTVLLMSADGGKSWICRPGTMQASHLPTACRN